ncbi:MAG TPA: VOC family protein [Acidobacteriaceae bacterium]|jgi:PhnB protein|nr:VOC family protein [Acidobacteriaceae bacterium]
MKIQPYLNFNGQCDEAFRLYERALGGTIVGQFTFGNSPMAGHYPGWNEKIMHIAMRVGDQMLLGCDAPPPHFSQPQGLRVCLEFEDVAEAERVYKALSEGGQIGMPLQETFWAKRFAMFADCFGTPWMINVSKPM